MTNSTSTVYGNGLNGCFASFDAAEKGLDRPLPADDGFDEYTLTDEDLKDILDELNGSFESDEEEYDFDDLDLDECEEDDDDSGKLTMGSVFTGVFSDNEAVNITTEDHSELIDRKVEEFFYSSPEDSDVIAICLALMLAYKYANPGKKLSEDICREIAVKANMLIERDVKEAIDEVVPRLRQLIGVLDEYIGNDYYCYLHTYYHLLFRNP